MSGVTVDDECVTKFKEMQLKHKIRSIMFKLTDDMKQCVVDHDRILEKEGGNGFEQFVKQLPEDAPRYAVVDIPFTTKSGADTEKLIFVYWCPEGCKPKQKMVYSSTKDAIRKALPGIQSEFQATDLDDMKLEDLQKKLSI